MPPATEKPSPPVKKINILHLRSLFAHTGGPEVLLQSLVAKADTRHFQHYLILLRDGKNPVTSSLEDFPHFQRHLGRLPWNWRTLLLDSLTHVCSYIREYNIDILHCHDNRANILGLMAARLLNLPVLASLHGYVETSLKMNLINLADRILANFFDRVVVGSDSLKNRLKLLFKEKVVVIKNSVDVASTNNTRDPIQLRKHLHLGEDEFIIMMVGRLDNEKGHIYLFEAARDLVSDNGSVKFVIVGDGPLRTELENLVAAYNLIDKVVFLGFYPNLPEIISLADLIVQPSLMESLPLTVLEAMVHEKAVVSSSVGDLPSAVQHGLTGLVVPPKDSESLAQAIRSLRNDRARLAAMGRAGRIHVEKNFSDTAMVQAMQKVYTALVAR